MDKKRNFTNVGFIYGYEPSGHFVVAKAVSDFIPKDIMKYKFFNLSDIFSNAAKIIVKGYLEVIQKTPALWSYLYDNPLISFLHKKLGLTAPTIYTRKLEKHIIKNSIDFIVSTHAFSSIIADRKIMKFRIKKHIGIITDIYAHSFWPDDLDKYFVPHYETYKSLVIRGIHHSKIEIIGMPLRKEFYLYYNQKHIRLKLNIQDRFSFLISGGSKGLGDIISIIDVIKSINKKVNVFVICGSNKHLFIQLKNYKYLGNVKVIPLGYHSNIAKYYAACDCIIGKPGGVTIFEIAAFSKPFIVWNALPGQEERNREFLKKHFYAICPKNERELRISIESIINNSDFYNKYSKNISMLHKKDAPFRIISYLIE
ncbi:MAG: glycosyltransferase [Elusimicrobiales bacterium]|nr:glycosyltransferase [Elusimicrobiales bacterium]